MNRLILAAALAATAATSAQAAPPPKPKLIVAISVDQYSSEVFKRYRPTYTAGLKRLANGVAYPTGYQSHAATETCPGHSTILTGRHPAGTGIVANSWIDAKTGMSVYCVSVPGVAEKSARGPQNMRVTTLGDWIKAAQPRARSFAVAGKDRAAITMAGKNADGVYWWVDGTGFTTSSYAGPATPRIVKPAEAFNAKLMSAWKATPPQLWPAASPTCAALSKRQQFGQLEVSGAMPPDMAKGVTEGDEFLSSKRFNDAMHASPTFDAAVADFAIDLIEREKLGRGSATDVLAVGLSATDYIGHRLGNGGPEMCVQQAALDATIGRLIDRIQALRIPVMVMLTADHGATDASERHFDEGGHGYRIDDKSLMNRLNDALEAELGIVWTPLNTEDPQQLYVVVDSEEAPRERILHSAVAWLKAQPEVRAVFTRAEVEAATVPPGTPADKLTVLQRFRESYDAERSGDIAVAYAERASYGVPNAVGETVAGHGTPWDYDRQIPILFWWPGAPAETRDQPIETVDIAPTLASVAGITPPVPVDGDCLDLGGNCRK
ncbi:alkaline phosphatase family protein [Sphingomonas sp. SRS2]|uniref:alkaline phosphatase family protein n=1 Tax=Sphingomonas sp. SRS2 TaxID=133190 RepID=UPI0006184F90|nr:alkaline phosphatase family protein [Sphingomonas sp. SRS2]KKC25171.1 nucleotide pyrophosphatase [Sphingomonas sp. SRS2]